MPVTKEKILRKQKKRERIMDAAAELFSRKNYHEVMMDDVAKLTSVAKGTVYNYFESKEDLYITIMRVRMNNLINSLKEKVESENSSINSLRSFVTHIYMFMMKYPNFFIIYQKESVPKENSVCKEILEMEVQLKKIIKGIIASGKTEGIFRSVNEDYTASLILGSIYGTIQKSIEANFNDEQKKQQRDNTFDFIIHGLYSGFNSIPDLPLNGKTIVLTRTVEQSQESAKVLSNLGANVISFPTLEIVAPSNWSRFDNNVSKPDDIDFIIFTSAHAVKMFSERCLQLGVKFNFNKTKTVAVGNKTSAVCKELDIPIHIVPQKFSAEGVITELSKYNIKNRVVFIPRSAIGREELPRGLKDLGAKIISVPVYNVSLPTKETIYRNKEALVRGNPQLFIFTSPSTFDNYLQIMNISNPAKYFQKYDVAAIGPTTKSEIEKRKVKVGIMPDEYTIDGLVKKITQYYSSVNNKTEIN